jgi:hypothetical protein
MKGEGRNTWLKRGPMKIEDLKKNEKKSIRTKNKKPEKPGNTTLHFTQRIKTRIYIYCHTGGTFSEKIRGVKEKKQWKIFSSKQTEYKSQNYLSFHK